MELAAYSPMSLSALMLWLSFFLVKKVREKEKLCFPEKDTSFHGRISGVQSIGWCLKKNKDPAEPSSHVDPTSSIDLKVLF